MNGKDSPEEEDLVMSEIHVGCPPHFSGPRISRFTFSLPSGVEGTRFNELFKPESSDGRELVAALDDDGDLVLPRRTRNFNQYFSVIIRHNVTSTIPSVGLQVWKAELVLSDWVMHKICTSSELDGVILLELGAGTGLVGILLGCVAQKVFLTDCGVEILDNCAQNIELNSGILHCQGAVHVRELDWMKPWPPDMTNSSTQESYSWTSSDLKDVERASMLVAADVIYRDDLTDAFFSTVERLMSVGSEKVLYLALEKRYNFSLNDLVVVANGYSCFRSHVMEQGAEYESLEDGSLPRFVGKRIDVNNIPQYVRDYDRGNDVELWVIKYNKNKL